MMLLREIVLNTPTFPYLWVPHCILMNIALRATLGIEISLPYLNSNIGNGAVIFFLGGGEEARWGELVCF